MQDYYLSLCDIFNKKHKPKPCKEIKNYLLLNFDHFYDAILYNNNL